MLNKLSMLQENDLILTCCIVALVRIAPDAPKEAEPAACGSQTSAISCHRHVQNLVGSVDP